MDGHTENQADTAALSRCAIPLRPLPPHGVQRIAGLTDVKPHDTVAPVIKTFRHKGLEVFFSSGSKAGIQPAHAPRLRLQLARLNAAQDHQDMNLPGWKLHPLSGALKNHWSVWVNGNWRLTFTFENGDAILVDYRDYH